MNLDVHRIIVSPLLPNADMSNFVSKLEPADIHARFGSLPEAGRIASLLVPNRAGLHALGAWNDRALIGTAMIAEAGGRRCELALLVRSDMKRRKVGTLLTCRAFAVARDSGADEMIAQVRADNIAALRLLYRAGFFPIGGPGFERAFAANL